MSHRTIERVIGRLLTDEELRLEFTRAPTRTLAVLAEQGWELTRLEIDTAARIDSRLQRCSLKTCEEHESR
jgi:hypothetical protein